MKNLSPVWPKTEAGESRRVGIEIEFAGLTPEDAAKVVCDELGGSIERRSIFDYVVRGSRFGDFGVELDMAALKQLGADAEQEATDSFLASTARALGWLAESAVPTEVVAPPIAWPDLDALEKLIERLAEAGAEGTQESIIFAFGLHLNPECAALDAEHLLSVLRAFTLMHDWLRKIHEVDLVRQITPFIKPFPGDYEELILDDGYAPDLPSLIDDYLQHNPTRNRALDMLPVFCHIDEGRVRARLPDEKINPRPTFHYRLPNCEIGREGWGLVQAWGGWLKVESLASQSQLLAQVSAARLGHRDQMLGVWSSEWVAELEERWLPDL